MYLRVNQKNHGGRVVRRTFKRTEIKCSKDLDVQEGHAIHGRSDSSVVVSEDLKTPSTTLRRQDTSQWLLVDDGTFPIFGWWGLIKGEGRKYGRSK